MINITTDYDISAILLHLVCCGGFHLPHDERLSGISMETDSELWKG